MVENPPANAGDGRDVGLISGSGRASEGGHGNPLQYSWLENPMDRGAWRATFDRVTQSDLAHTHIKHRQEERLAGRLVWKASTGLTAK